jgi:hypothetical protein
VVSGQTRISVLKDISLYLADHQDSTLPLADLFLQIHAKFNGTLPIEPKKENDTELYATLAEVVPNYDADRVFASDIKKILNWYLILFTFVPELFPAKVAKAPKAEKEEKEVKEVKKPAAKKADKKAK